jgi:hypothetical protein
MMKYIANYYDGLPGGGGNKIKNDEIGGRVAQVRRAIKYAGL